MPMSSYLDAIVSLTNYDPEHGLLKPIDFVIDMVMVVLYISLCVRTNLRLFGVDSDRVWKPLHWPIYYMTEPFMRVVGKVFPKADTYMVTLLPLLTVLTLYGADILMNLAFKFLDRQLMGG